MNKKHILKNIAIAISLLLFAGCGGGVSQNQSPLSNNNDAGTTTGSENTGSTSISGSLAWDAPSQNIDGSTLTDLSGYKLYYGRSSGSYSGSIDLENATSLSLAMLAQQVQNHGIYYITLTAYNTAGNESTFSNEIIIEL